MIKDSDFVGLLPAFVAASSIRYFGDKGIGEFVNIPCSAEPSVDGLGDVARHLAQFVEKRTGEIHIVNGLGLQQGTIYLLQSTNRNTNYSVYSATRRKDNDKPSIAISKDLACTHEFGILRLYVQELKPNTVAQSK